MDGSLEAFIPVCIDVREYLDLESKRGLLVRVMEWSQVSKNLGLDSGANNDGIDEGRFLDVISQYPFLTMCHLLHSFQRHHDRPGRWKENFIPNDMIRNPWRFFNA